MLVSKKNTYFVLKQGCGGRSLESEAARMQTLYEEHSRLQTPKYMRYDPETDTYAMEYIDGSLLRDWICTCSTDKLESVADKVVTLLEAFQLSFIGTQCFDKVPSKVHYAISKLEEAMQRDDDLKNDHLLLYLFETVKKMFSGQTEIQFEVEKWKLSDVAEVVLGEKLKLFSCPIIDEPQDVPAIVCGHGDLTLANIIVDEYEILRPIDPRSKPGNCNDEEKVVWPGSFVLDGSVFIGPDGGLHDPDGNLKKSIAFSQVLQKKLNIKTYNARQFIRDMRVALERLKIPKAEENPSEKTLLINRIRTDLVLFILFHHLEMCST